MKKGFGSYILIFCYGYSGISSGNLVIGKSFGKICCIRFLGNFAGKNPFRRVYRSLRGVSRKSGLREPNNY